VHWRRHYPIAGDGDAEGFPDAERLVKRLVARELTLSFVPRCRAASCGGQLRGKKYQLRLTIEYGYRTKWSSLWQEAHIKLSCLVSDLLGLSARRMLKALADGETTRAALDRFLADHGLRATPEQLCDALVRARTSSPV